jgi:hypothetical protein
MRWSRRLLALELALNMAKMVYAFRFFCEIWLGLQIDALRMTVRLPADRNQRQRRSGAARTASR